MELKFKVAARIAAPMADIFEAVADPARLSAYFTTGGASARLEAGTTVYWEFHDFPGAFPVWVIDVEPGRKIAFDWEAKDEVHGRTETYRTRVTMTFDPEEGDRTRVSITEEGWHDTPGGLASSYGNCQGWTQMLCCMKAWVEHGIRLRDGMFA